VFGDRAAHPRALFADYARAQPACGARRSAGARSPAASTAHRTNLRSRAEVAVNFYTSRSRRSSRRVSAPASSPRRLGWRCAALAIASRLTAPGYHVWLKYVVIVTGWRRLAGALNASLQWFFCQPARPRSRCRRKRS
jgi:hypothetical protein